MFRFRPFRFWCQKVLPLVYDDSLSYYEVISKIVLYLNNLIKDTKEISEEVEELRKMIENVGEGQLYSIVEQVLNEMKADGSFDEIIQQALLKEVVDYNFEQPALFSDYTKLDEYYSYLDSIDSEWLASGSLGVTEAGQDIKYYIIGKPDEHGHVFRTGLVFADMDAREYQGTYVLANMIKTIVHNLDNDTGASVHGVDLKKLFTGYKLFVVPTANPDGYKLCMENLYEDLTTAQKSAIANMVQQFIRGEYFDGSDFTEAELAELEQYCGGDYSTYVFRAKDIPHLWHGDINGIDIHYNCYSESMRSRLQAYANLNHWPNFPAPRGYYDPTGGFMTPEGNGVKNLIQSEGISSVLDLHQRGPTMFFQYKYGGPQFVRNKFIAQKISDATQTPVTQGNSDRIGFMGWFYETYNYSYPTHFGAIKEIGWSNTHVLVNGASDPLYTNGFMINPMPRELQSKVYLNEINGLLEFMYQAVCNMCVNHFNSELNMVDFASARPINLPANRTVVDLQYFEDNGSKYAELANTTNTLIELYNRYESGTMLTMDVTPARVPNIKLPGAYPNGRLVFYRGVNFGYALFFGNNGDMWSCEVSANTSTTWRLTSNVSGYVVVPAGENRVVTVPYDGYVVFSGVGNQSNINSVNLGRSITDETSTITFTNTGENSVTLFYIIAGKNYPSREV